LRRLHILDNLRGRLHNFNNFCFDDLLYLTLNNFTRLETIGVVLSLISSAYRLRRRGRKRKGNALSRLNVLLEAAFDFTDLLFWGTFPHQVFYFLDQTLLATLLLLKLGHHFLVVDFLLPIGLIDEIRLPLNHAFRRPIESNSPIIKLLQCSEQGIILPVSIVARQDVLVCLLHFPQCFHHLVVLEWNFGWKVSYVVLCDGKSLHHDVELVLQGDRECHIFRLLKFYITQLALWSASAHPLLLILSIALTTSRVGRSRGIIPRLDTCCPSHLTIVSLRCRLKRFKPHLLLDFNRCLLLFSLSRWPHFAFVHYKRAVSLIISSLFSVDDHGKGRTLANVIKCLIVPLICLFIANQIRRLYRLFVTCALIDRILWLVHLCSFSSFTGLVFRLFRCFSSWNWLRWLRWRAHGRLDESTVVQVFNFLLRHHVLDIVVVESLVSSLISSVGFINRLQLLFQLEWLERFPKALMTAALRLSSDKIKSV